MTPIWEQPSPEEEKECCTGGIGWLCWSHRNGITFSGAEQQAVFLETTTSISARSWELSSGEERFGRISRNWTRLNFHLAHHLFLAVIGKADCRSEVQPGATFGFGSKGWRVHLEIVVWCLRVVGRTCRKARCLQDPALVITATKLILHDWSVWGWV